MRPDDGRLSLWPVAVIGFFAILAAASITPVVRLNSNPPADFVSLPATAKGANPKQAAGYWETAVQVIQWRFLRTERLPEQVPPDFTLGDTTADRMSADEQAARAAYWSKLRQDWMKAENWHKTIEFDANWMIDDARAVSRGIHDFLVDHT
jgi:hypothetical protein